MYIASTAKNEPPLPRSLRGMLKAVLNVLRAVPRGLVNRSSSQVTGLNDADPEARLPSALGTADSDDTICDTVDCADAAPVPAASPTATAWAEVPAGSTFCDGALNGVKVVDAAEAPA